MACDREGVLATCAVAIVLLGVLNFYGVDRYLQMRPHKLREGVDYCDEPRHRELHRESCPTADKDSFFVYSACCEPDGIWCCTYAQDWLLIVVPLVAVFFLWVPVYGCLAGCLYCCHYCIYEGAKWVRERPARRAAAAAAKAAGQPYGLRRIVMNLRTASRSDVLSVSSGVAVVLAIVFLGFGIERYLQINPFKRRQGRCSTWTTIDPLARYFVYGGVCCDESRKCECCHFAQDWLLIVLPFLATWPSIWWFSTARKDDKWRAARAAKEAAAAAAAAAARPSAVSIEMS